MMNTNKEKPVSYNNVLHEMTATTPTVLWNDSCATKELSTSIDRNGAVGATCNPVIVLEVLKKEWEAWKPRIEALVTEMPNASEDDIAWRLTEEMSIKAAALLKPVFDREKGVNGRLSIQTNPKYWRDPKRLVEQAVHFNTLAPNIIVKIPATEAGIVAIEEATALGISINATVSFTVPQALAVGAAVERGLVRREKRGEDISTMGPVCTIMVGRLDDWLKVVADKQNISVDPGVFEWAGVAAMKKAYAVYEKRGYRTRMLSAAMRNHMHWSEFIGGNLVISPPFKWQERYITSGVTVENRIGKPVRDDIMAVLEGKFEEFRRAYAEDGMTPAQFDTYGATRRTLRQFCKATEDMAGMVRDVLIKNPD
jgi:transaldolase